MEYKVFYRKYRPTNFEELLGQDNIKEILVNSIKTNRIAHAYIFTGPRGTGKTSTAKIFAKTLNCLNNSNGLSCNECVNCNSYNESADIIEIDAASNNGVEEIRALRDSVKISPYSSKYKIYIIDEVHMLSNSAWNAFLKTLEEPPSHVIFILATTEVGKIPETVMSRCQRFDFSRISEDVMFSHLSNICKNENVDIEEKALYEIIKLSNGCLRDALSFLDEISKISKNITLDMIQDVFGVITNNNLEQLYLNVINNNKNNINTLINSIEKNGVTPLKFINDFVDYLMNIILNNNLSGTEINGIKNLIFNLNTLTLNFNSVVNPFTLIKIELITSNYFPGNNFVDISQNNTIIDKNKEILVEKEEVINSNIEDDIVKSKIDKDKIKKIRINNSYVNVSKEFKTKFIKSWDLFFNHLSVIGNYNLIGFVENITIQVVSETNVLFSFKSLNESILFNDNVSIIETSYNDFANTNYKFYALSIDEWIDEKGKFIKNKDKKYEYINEDIEELNSDNVKTFDLAENIFGEDIIEIK